MNLIDINLMSPKYRNLEIDKSNRKNYRSKIGMIRQIINRIIKCIKKKLKNKMIVYFLKLHVQYIVL